jgi:hypothetical protein
MADVWAMPGCNYAQVHRSHAKKIRPGGGGVEQDSLTGEPYSPPWPDSGNESGNNY